MEKIAVRVKTEKEWYEIVKFVRKKEPDYTYKNALNTYPEELCVDAQNGCYAYRQFYEKDGYKIYSYNEFDKQYMNTSKEPELIDNNWYETKVKDNIKVKGEYYVADNGNIHKWGTTDSEYYFTGTSIKPNVGFYKGGGCFIKTWDKKATLEEIKWLDACILANKFISKEEALKPIVMNTYGLKVGDVLPFKKLEEWIKSGPNCPFFTKFKQKWQRNKQKRKQLN